MNILKHELKIYFKSTLIWTASMAFLVVLFAIIYPSFQSSAEMMTKMLSAFPESIKSALGLDTINLSDALGFYGFMFVYITLAGSIQAMNLGLSILSNELRDKTADFLLAKPIRRINIIHAKFIASLLNILFTNIIFFIVSKVSLDIIAENGYSFRVFICFIGSLLMIQLFFLTLGMFLSVFMNKLKTVIPVSLGIVFAFFVVNLLNESLTNRPLSTITPFAYFSTGKIYENAGYDTNLILLNTILIVFFTIGCYIQYIKKDFPSV